MCAMRVRGGARRRGKSLRPHCVYRHLSALRKKSSARDPNNTFNRVAVISVSGYGVWLIDLCDATCADGVLVCVCGFSCAKGAKKVLQSLGALAQKSMH